MKTATKKISSELALDTWKPIKGQVRTIRYSFEITDELVYMLEERVLSEQILHRKRISTSAVIRQALCNYLSPTSEGK
jgi:hypothetical protein